MVKGLLGQKLNMSVLFDSHGRAVPVTEVLVTTNTVIALREKEIDGYKAAQIGFGTTKKINKAETGHLKKSGVKVLPLIIKEVEFDGELNPGQEIRLEEVFHKGSMVDVIGKSKGKGFAGVIKRHGFSGGPKTHGQSDRHRAPGSIGATTTPGRVFKGMKMAGHMGNAPVSIFGLEVMDVDKENNRVFLKGSIPGPSGGIVVLKKSKKKREVYHEPEIPVQPVLSGETSEEKAGVEASETNTEVVETSEKASE